MHVPEAIVVICVFALSIEQSPLTAQVFLPLEFEFASSFTEITADGGSGVSRHLMSVAGAARALEKFAVATKIENRTTKAGFLNMRRAYYRIINKLHN